MDPVSIGAALDVADLESHRDWLVSGARDLEIQDFFRIEVIRGDWRPLVDEALRRLDGFEGRLGIHGPFWGFTLDSPDPDTREVAVRRLMAGLDICAALGASQMVVHSPYTTWDRHNLPVSPGAAEAKIEAVRATLAPVLARAEGQGVELVVENIEDVDPAARRLMAEALGSDALRLSVDTGHAHYAHVSTGGPPVDAFLRDAGARLAHVHLQDACGHADRHWAIGRGSVPWQGVFEALAEMAHRPRLVLELKDRSGTRESMDWLSARGYGR